MNNIEIRNMTVDYGNKKGVFDISFSVKEGEVFGFLGPNGAGKTTTIRQLMGFSAPQSGTCSIFGKDCFKQASDIQQRVGYLPGEIAFMDEMTGSQFIKFIAELKGLKHLQRAEELMTFFELNPSGKIKKMSKGMKQKIGIICAFMHDPDLLILDEPTSGLDPLMQTRFIELVASEKQKGKTILMSSHIFEEVERTCDRAAIIKQGHLMGVENINALKEKRQKDYLVTFEDAASAASFTDIIPYKSSCHDTTVTVSVKGDIMPFIQDMVLYTIVDLDVKTQTLETLFMHYYGGESHD